MEKLLSLIGNNIRLLLLLGPFVIIIWEGLFLQMTGSDRHWRRFGVAAYIGGFSLAMGGLHQLGEREWKHTIAVVTLLFVIGAAIPFVTLLVREGRQGELINPRGPVITRFLGIAIYVFCVLLVLETPGE